MSLDGGHMLYAWSRIEAPCTDPEDVLGQTVELWRDRVVAARNHRLIRRAGCPTDPATTLQSPVRAAETVAFVETFGDLQTRIVRYDPGARSFRVVAARHPISSLDFDTAGRALTISPIGAHTARLRREG